MLKLLVSTADTVQNSKYCNVLANDNIKLISTNDGRSTLNNYLNIEPDIFLLGSDFKDLSYLEIIDTISSIANEQQKCNTIITTNKKEDLLLLQNTAKIYKVLSNPVNLEKLANTVHNMKNNLQLEELTIPEINALFLLLNLGLGSNGVHYLTSAIQECYYQPSLLDSLNNILNLIAYQNNVTQENVRENMRCTLNRLKKNGISNTNNPLLKLLETQENVTPKFFIEIATTYFQIRKKKK